MKIREVSLHLGLRAPLAIAAIVPYVMWKKTPVPMLEEPNHLDRAPFLGLVLVVIVSVSRRWVTRIPLVLMVLLWLLYLWVSKIYAPWAGDVGAGAGMEYLPYLTAAGTGLCALIPFRDPHAQKGSWPPAD